MYVACPLGANLPDALSCQWHKLIYGRALLRRDIRLDVLPICNAVAEASEFWIILADARHLGEDKVLQEVKH